MKPQVEIQAKPYFTWVSIVDFLHVIKMHKLLSDIRQPKSFVFTVNAGQIDQNHWTQDKQKGGGRIVGEVCHFVDLLRFLTSSQITGSKMSKIKYAAGDTISVTLEFSDGSIGTIHYFANGAKGYQKERLEVFTAGKILKLDNYRRCCLWLDRFKSMKSWSQDKGHQNCVNEFVASVVEVRVLLYQLKKYLRCLA